MSNKPATSTPPQGRTIAVVGDVYRFLAAVVETNGKDGAEIPLAGH